MCVCVLVCWGGRDRETGREGDPERERERVKKELRMQCLVAYNC